MRSRRLLHPPRPATASPRRTPTSLTSPASTTLSDDDDNDNDAAMFRQLWLYTLQHTQFVVTTLTAYFILRIRTAHSLYFGAGTLVAAFSGAFPLSPAS